jgi:hypothetical protein
MKSQQIIAIFVVGAVIVVSGLFVIHSSITTVTNVGGRTVADLFQYGNVTTLKAISGSREIINLNSSTLSFLNNSLSLYQIRYNGYMLIYNSTNASSFIPYWNVKFTLLIQVAAIYGNLSYPNGKPTLVVGEFCNSNTSLGATECTTTTHGYFQNLRLQYSNFTLPDGSPGFAEQNYTEWHDNGLDYAMNSVGFGISQEIQLAEAMEPISEITTMTTTS